MQYKAFLSYSHAADGKLAPALQSSLQRFAKPWYRLRALRVFRDATSLSANPALWPAIEQALGEAEYFLLMASPRSAQSHWVGREIDWWLTHRSADRMLVLLTDGELAWDDRVRDFDWSRTTALAPLLRGRFADEPLYVDLRWAENADNLSLRHSQFRSAILDIAAPLHGRPKDELDGEDVRQHRRTRRLTGAAIAVLSLLTVATAGAAWIAVGQSRIAKSEQKRAEEARDAESRQRKQAVASAAEARRQRGIAVEKQVEAERQQRIAEEQQRIAEEQRRIAVVQKAAAEHQARVAMANQRSLLSRTALREEAPVRALLIAAEAVRISADAGDPRVPAAEDVLRQALATLGGRPLGGHDRPIGNVAVSLDGHWAATATWGGEIRLWDLDREEEGGAPPRILAGHTKGVRDLAFTPDGRWLATASEDGTARLWDLAGTPVRSVVLRGHEKPINTLAISPDGRWLATGGADQTARLWDLKAADPAAASRALRGHTYEIERLAFRSDSRRLVTTSRDRFLLLWDLAGAEGPPLQLDGPESSVTSAALSPDGRWLAARDAKEKVLLWDLRAADVAGSARVLPGPGGFSVRFSPDSRWLTAAGGDAGIQLWDLRAAGSAAAPVPLPADLQGSRSATRLAFSPDGRWLATDGDGGSEAARLWDLRSLGPGLRPLRLPGTGRTHQLLFNPEPRDEATLVVTSPDAVRAWKIDREGIAGGPSVLHGHDFAVEELALSGDGRWLVTAAVGDTAARLWDLRAPAFGSSGVLGRDLATNRQLLVREDGRFLAALGADQTKAEYWDLEARSPGRSSGSLWHQDTVTAAAFLPDGRLATTSKDQTVHLWDLAAPDPEKSKVVLEGHTGPVRCLAPRPAGRWLATAGDDQTVRLWDLRSRNPSASPIVLRGQEGAVYRLVFSPDGRWLASAGGGPSARLWDLRSGGRAPASYPLGGHDGPIRVLAFSPDGRWLFTGTDDDHRNVDSGRHVAHLWDLRSRNPGASPLALGGGAGETVWLGGFSPDGRWLALAGEIGPAVLWRLGPGGPQAPVTLDRLNSYAVEGLAFSPDGRWLATHGKSGTVTTVWDLALKDPRTQPLELTGRGDILGLAFSPDGRILAAASGLESGRADGLRLWDLTAENPAASSTVLSGHDGTVLALAFNPGGRWLATAGVDRTVRRWTYDPKELVAQACRAAGSNLNHIEWDRYFPGEPYKKICAEFPGVAGN